MIEKLKNSYHFIQEINKLKNVFRNTITQEDRKESTAEHSWSASMIVMIFMDELRKEFGKVDELKTIKLTLIHDIVEIYAGDVTAFDMQARKEKEKLEKQALEKLVVIDPEFGKQLYDLWHEFENKTSIEAKIAKAADAICPLLLRLSTKQVYFNISLDQWEKTKLPHFEFSQTFKMLYQQIKADMLQHNLIKS